MIYRYIGLNPVMIKGKLVKKGDKVSLHDAMISKVLRRVFRPEGEYSGVDVPVKKTVKKAAVKINTVKIKRKRGKNL